MGKIKLETLARREGEEIFFWKGKIRKPSNFALGEVEVKVVDRRPVELSRMEKKGYASLHIGVSEVKMVYTRTNFKDYPISRGDEVGLRDKNKTLRFYEVI